MGELVNKRILITRSGRQAQSFAQMLRRHGAHPILFPVIKIAPTRDLATLDLALQNLVAYHWLIFTSANGVRAVWSRFSQLGIKNMPGKVKVAAIGPKTAQALVDRGCQPDFVPEEFVLEEIIPGLGSLKGKRVLLARADIARPALPKMILAEGGKVDDVIAYCTLPAKLTRGGLSRLKSGLDVLTFASPSAVENFTSLMKTVGLDVHNLAGDPIFAYIGPITGRRARDLGLPLNVIAKDFTIEGLVEALIRYYTVKEVTLL